jgi:hypothetical protein
VPDATALSARVQRVCAWSGPGLLLVFFLAFIPLCRMWPPPDPSWTAEHVKALYMEHTDAKRAGIAICLAGWTLMLPWGIGLASLTARGEGGFRILGLIQVTSAATTMMIGELMLLIWGVNTFRPDVFAAASMQQFNDLGWFIFVMYWAPGVLWVWSVAWGIFIDRSPDPAFPRWVGYLNVWVGFSFFPACLGLFFKTGPFAYNGAFTVWLPAGVFFLWYLLMSVLMLRAIGDGRGAPVDLSIAEA